MICVTSVRTLDGKIRCGRIESNRIEDILYFSGRVGEVEVTFQYLNVLPGAVNSQASYRTPNFVCVDVVTRPRSLVFSICVSLFH